MPISTMHNFVGKPVYQFRISKYDPAHRDPEGHYLLEEWTSFSDIGKVFQGELLTFDFYEQIEKAHLQTAQEFLRESGVRELLITSPENHHQHSILGISFDTGVQLSGSKLEHVMRDILRERWWCKLEASACFIHFGWDYYMYIGVPDKCDRAQRMARELGLYCEAFPSPYQ